MRDADRTCGESRYVLALTACNGELIAEPGFSIAGGRVSAYWARWGWPYVRDDLNCDALVNGADIDEFFRCLGIGGCSCP